MLLHVRYAEIALKGRKRAWFEDCLRHNIARALDVPARQVKCHRGRILVDLPDADDPREPLDALRRTYGVASAGLVHRVERSLPALQEVGVRLAREAQAEGQRSFKVEARRPDKRFPHSSYEVCCAIGDAVLEATDLRVDVHDPDLVIYVEVRDEGVTVHTQSVRGPGGVPVGTAGRALCLLSGGIDSPVAAGLALKRGLHVDHVYFHAFPYTGDKVLEKVLTIARALSPWTPKVQRVFVLSTTRIQDAIQAGAPEELRVLLLRRAMYRLAREVLRARGYKALVTGESLGQVASQTPENLLCVDVVVPDVLVLRPLIGLDKDEIVQRARALGTYETSILPYQDCCSLFAPRFPATAATPARCEAAEAGLDLAALEAESLADVAIYRVARGGPAERVEEALTGDGPPADARRAPDPADA